MSRQRYKGEASKLGKIRVVDRAIVNNKPIKPNKIINLFFGIALGLFGISFAFVIEFFDNTIKSIEQIERRNLSILALIPSIFTISKKDKQNKNVIYKKIKHEIRKKINYT